VAQTYDRAGHQLSQVEIRGGNDYDFTGEILAWAAIQAAHGAVKGTDSLGPVDAFGLRTLEHACHGFGFGEPSTQSSAGPSPPVSGVQTFQSAYLQVPRPRP